MNPLFYTDFYKVDHRRQYPAGTEYIYSNWTARYSRLPGVRGSVVFGIQYFVKEFLQKRFAEFFNTPKDVVLKEYQRRMDTSLGAGAITTEHLAALHDLGYLPVRIKALKEGTVCPLRTPMLTIVNTKPEFYWVTNFLETLLSNVIWHPMTSATIAHEYRKLLDGYAGMTSDMPDFVGWQGHDFSMRGQSSVEASAASGGGHLLSFTGTDTIPALAFLEEYYNANAEKELIGGSVPATEHSVMCTGGKETELDTYRRLITEVYPKGIVSIVSDTWDYWKTLTQVSLSLKEQILAREGKLVFRPDSGDPVKIICGDREELGNEAAFDGTVQTLWNIFGGTINSKGYKQLDPHVGVIYGDSITFDRCKAICEGLERKGFATTNVVFGIGSYTYQHVTRDSLGFAMKATWSQVNGLAHELFKTPATDVGVKFSAKGLLRVNDDLSLSESVTSDEEKQGLLELVYEDGKLLREETLAEIRARLATQR